MSDLLLFQREREITRKMMDSLFDARNPVTGMTVGSLLGRQILDSKGSPMRAPTTIKFRRYDSMKEEK